MTPREIEVLNIMEHTGQCKVRQIAKHMEKSVGYTRHLLDYLIQQRCLEKDGKDTYRIVSKGVDMVIGEYQHTLGVIEKVIQKHSEDQKRTIIEIQRLRLRKKEIAHIIRD